MKRLYLFLVLLFASLYARSQTQCQYNCSDLHIGVNLADCNYVNLCVFTPTNVKINNVCLDYEIRWFIGNTQFANGECASLYPAQSPNLILAEVTLWDGEFGNSAILCRDTLTFDFEIEDYCCKQFHIASNPLYPDSCNGGVLCLYDQNGQIISSLEGYDVVWSDGETGQCNGITAANQNTQLCAYITKYAGAIPNSAVICRDTVCEFIKCDSCSLGNLALIPVKYYPTPCDTSYFRVLLNGVGVTSVNFPHISLTWPDGSHGSFYGPVVGGACVLVQEWAGVPFQSELICERTICYNCCRTFHIDFHPEYGKDPCKGALLCLYDDVTNQPIGNYPQYDNVTWSDGSIGACAWVDQSDAPQICAIINPSNLRNCRDTVCFNFNCNDTCELSGYKIIPVKSADPCKNAYFAVQDPLGNMVPPGGSITFIWNDGSTNFIYGRVDGGACVELTLWSGEPYKSKVICKVKICYDCRGGGEPRSSNDEVDPSIETMVSANSINVVLPQNSAVERVQLSNMNGTVIHNELINNRQYIELSTGDIPAGMYIIQYISTKTQKVQSKKIVLVK